MGMDLLYIRCPLSVIEKAKHDRALVEQLSFGHGGDECVDLGRAQLPLCRILGGSDFFLISDDHAHWAGRALAGDGWLDFDYQNAYGSPRFLLPDQVRAIAAELEPIDEAAFRRLCRGEPHLETYLVPNFNIFREFYLRAAAAEQGVVVFPG